LTEENLDQSGFSGSGVSDECYPSAGLYPEVELRENRGALLGICEADILKNPPWTLFGEELRLRRDFELVFARARNF
jgi:hypothetical protein